MHLTTIEYAHDLAAEARTLVQFVGNGCYREVDMPDLATAIDRLATAVLLMTMPADGEPQLDD